MINKKSRDEVKRMRHAGHIVALVHQKMKEVIEPGISTKELDNIAMGIIKKEGNEISFKKWMRIGVPFTVITTVASSVLLWVLWS